MDVMLPPASAFEFGSGDTGKELFTGKSWLVGWALENTSAVAVARLAIRDGNGTNAPMRAPIRFAPNESVRDAFPQQPIVFERAIWLDVTSGGVTGVLYVLMGQELQLAEGRVLVAQTESGSWDYVGAEQ